MTTDESSNGRVEVGAVGGMDGVEVGAARSVMVTGKVKSDDDRQETMKVPATTAPARTN